MAESDQPKKETVRIELPLPPLPNPPQPIAEPPETVRIQLPVRETDGSPLSSQSSHEDISSTNFFPPPNPPVPSKPLSAAVRPGPASPPAGPKRDTVRIPLNSEPLRPSQKKTQSLITLPQVAPQNRSIRAAAEEKSPMVLYWLLLGLSALILIIQIWTYFS
jgi:hypothetical protein